MCAANKYESMQGCESMSIGYSLCAVGLSDFLRSLAAKEGQQPWTWSIKDWHLGTLGALLTPMSTLMSRFPPLMLAL